MEDSKTLPASAIEIAEKSREEIQLEKFKEEVGKEALFDTGTVQGEVLKKVLIEEGEEMSEEDRRTLVSEFKAYLTLRKEGQKIRPEVHFPVSSSKFGYDKGGYFKDLRHRADFLDAQWSADLAESFGFTSYSTDHISRLRSIASDRIQVVSERGPDVRPGEEEIRNKTIELIKQRLDTLSFVRGYVAGGEGRSSFGEEPKVDVLKVAKLDRQLEAFGFRVDQASGSYEGSTGFEEGVARSRQEIQEKKDREDAEVRERRERQARAERSEKEEAAQLRKEEVRSELSAAVLPEENPRSLVEAELKTLEIQKEEKFREYAQKTNELRWYDFSFLGGERYKSMQSAKEQFEGLVAKMKDLTVKKESIN